MVDELKYCDSMKQVESLKNITNAILKFSIYINIIFGLISISNYMLGNS